MAKGFILCITIIIITISDGNSQFSLGPKIGGVFNKSSYENRTPLNDANIDPQFIYSYNFGAVLIYQLSDNFAFHTEVLYAKKKKKLDGGIQDLFSHDATYKFIEVPVLFAYTFKKKYYTGFVEIGGNIGYWLSGKGEIKSFEYDEVGIDSYQYKISFGSMPDGDDTGNLFLEDANRMQVGIEIGVGAFINTTSPKNRILVELKFQQGHTWLAKDQLYIGLDEYSEDFRFSNNSLSLSVGYLFGFDLGQGKEGNTTSTVDKKRRKKKK